MNDSEFKNMYLLEESNWWYVGKRIIVFELMKLFLKLNNYNILNVGCGTGFLSKQLERFGEVYSFDCSQEAVDFSKKRGVLNVERAFADNLPVEDSSSDVVFALDLIEHIDDDKGAIVEFHKKLKRDGFLVITVPAFGFLWSKHDEALSHKRRYTKIELRELLVSAGFSVKKLSYTNFFIFFPVLLHRILGRLISKLLLVKSNKIKSDNPSVSLLLNKLLVFMYRVEAKMLKWINLPFGVSIVCFAQKK